LVWGFLSGGGGIYIEREREREREEVLERRKEGRIRVLKSLLFIKFVSFGLFGSELITFRTFLGVLGSAN